MNFKHLWHVSHRETFDIYAMKVNTRVAQEVTIGLGYWDLQISLPKRE